MIHHSSKHSVFLLVLSLFTPFSGVLADSILLNLWNSEKKWITEEVIRILEVDRSIYGRQSPRNIAFFDLDHTLIDTDILIPIYRKDSEPKKPYRTVDSKCIGKISEDEIPDYTVFDRENLYSSRIIRATWQEWLRSVQDKDTVTVILTARSSSHNFSSIREKLALAGGEPDHIIPVNSKLFQDRIWKQERWQKASMKSSLPSGFKKPILMAAILDAYRIAGNDIRLIRYYEDTDSYFIQSINLLTLLYPKMEQEYYDVIRTRRFFLGNSYKLVPVLSSTGRNIRKSSPLFQGWNEEYNSEDCEEIGE